MIIIISGSCGAGKTSITDKLSVDTSYKKTVRLRVDEFYYGFIQSGFIEPWQDAAMNQNSTVMKALAACSCEYSKGNYEVFVEGVITKKMIEPWQNLSRNGFDVRYIILRPNESVTVKRVLEREQNIEYPIEPEFVSKVCSFFADLGEYESHTIDTSEQSLEESVALIKKRLGEDCFKL